MTTHFSHLTLAHYLWERLLTPYDYAIDATCGKGKDTLKLASLLTKGSVFSLDIQQQALEKTRALLPSSASSRVKLILDSHEHFPESCRKHPIKLVVYNLGYLPGGDHSLTTQTVTTIKSVEDASSLLIVGGALSITCYPGHSEGAREESALRTWIKDLDPQKWQVAYFKRDRILDPSLLWIRKIANTSLSH